MQFRSDTKKAKGLGTAKHGFGHWWMQRLSAVLLIPLGIWFAYSMISMDSLAPDTLILWLHNPVPAILMALFSMSVVYHGALGLQVIIEDYVSNKKSAMAMLILLKFAMLIMVVTILFSLFKLIS